MCQCRTGLANQEEESMADDKEEGQWASKGKGGARKPRPTTLSRSTIYLGGPVCPSLPPSSSLWPLSILTSPPVSTYNRKDAIKNSPEYSLQNVSVWLGKDVQAAAGLVSAWEGQLNSSFLGPTVQQLWDRIVILKGWT